ncbi:UDP-glucose 4-epimerase [Cryobacterium psychrotolerans]|uniref:UDP-glucose 4-epimerase n=1 Tax=Cryobacterium psychrotolerans TaxID=386301 RepID=A0A1G9BU29_9MICO|nr:MULTISPECIES: polysaccharide biosynthesis protein [Cryobacterium]TFD42952.1 NAD-dependent epimerase/dehydratase family protein [Cryobacterium sp. TMT1-2-1]TFD84089.1 NAD-dependent epimerase/dehydratase family protein [Cryobacterium psychrotolerans]SDK42999.1 UDP-glucose 4-epimerase [Cryobacterium psychrotolerans]
MNNQNDYQGKRILITGGTGSFGHTVTEKLLTRDVEEIRILSRDEAKQDLMRHEIADPRVRFYVGDIRDYLSVERASRDVDFVFHAAALKQVPSCEFFPMEAVRTNIVGSENVVRAAEFSGVQSVVCLSTDKAVYPVNAMGMSKAIMEKVAQSHGLNNPNAETTVSCVRYGNVMYSRGSVIPLFIRQLKDGKNLTVTNPEMTRFMMSLSDSVELVEFAFHEAKQGDLFIRKAQACTVGDLAQATINLFRSPSHVEVIGTRHAEKLSEALASREELARSQDMGDYFRIQADNRDLNYSIYVEQGDVALSEYTDYDSHTVERMSVSDVEDLLLTLPEVRTELALAGLPTERES